MSRIQFFSILGAMSFVVLILELVRRRALSERYSLLWLLAGLALLAFGLWRNLVDIVGALLGVYYTPAALILVFTLFFMVILLHFSTVVSQLARQNRILAERIAILEWRAGRVGVARSRGVEHDPDLRDAERTCPSLGGVQQSRPHG